MGDLDIWSGEPSPDALVELAAWALPRRAPYFGKLRRMPRCVQRRSVRSPGRAESTA